MTIQRPVIGPDESATEIFAEHRDLLFAVAYRMLGSVADAEDLVQDAWLRWTSDDRSGIARPRAYLVQITTRLALDRLRSARSTRETYVGPWLPEPLLVEPDASERVALSESVSVGMMVVLETLSPLERAVFVLREAFGFSYGEIAEAIGRDDAAVRQLSHRARRHVQERRPRYEPDAVTHRQVSERFLAACTGGDMRALLDLLAPGVVLVADSGGLARAPRRPIHGADKVARFLASVIGDVPGDWTIQQRFVNGGPGVVGFARDQALGTYALTVVDGRIEAIHMVVNPHKLQHLHPDSETIHEFLSRPASSEDGPADDVDVVDIDVMGIDVTGIDVER
ncbi:MAG: RNA polymerase sigma factor SigJ [Frankiaceae bacterium]